MAKQNYNQEEQHLFLNNTRLLIPERDVLLLLSRGILPFGLGAEPFV
jgi:hypothetical protein